MRLTAAQELSNFSVITGKCSLALARDLTTMPSAVSAVVLREVANSLMNRSLTRAFCQALSYGARVLALPQYLGTLAG